jgi:hypothetical protein
LICAYGDERNEWAGGEVEDPRCALNEVRLRRSEAVEEDEE